MNFRYIVLFCVFGSLLNLSYGLSNQDLANELVASNNWDGDFTCNGPPSVFVQVFGLGDVNWSGIELQILTGPNTDVFPTLANQSICSQRRFNFVFVSAPSGFPSDGSVVILGNGIYETSFNSSDFVDNFYTSYTLEATLTANLPFTNVPSTSPSLPPSPSSSPTLAPSSNPTATPSTTPSAAPTITCNYPDERFTVLISADDYPGQVAWDLFELVEVDGKQTSVLIHSEMSDSDGYFCLSAGTYVFNIVDCEGDGICCGVGMGSYTLFLDGEVIRTGGEYRYSEPTRFTVQPPQTAAPTVSAALCNQTLGEEMFEVLYIPDMAPMETNWQLLQLGTNFSTLIIDSQLNATLCLSNGDYIWSIEDEGGNGICCGNGMGFYEVRLDGMLLKSGGEFTNVDFIEFEV